MHERKFLKPVAFSVIPRLVLYLASTIDYCLLEHSQWNNTMLATVYVTY